MSAEDLEVVAVLIPNPEVDSDVSQAVVVNSTIGFLYNTPQIRTLSTNNPDNADNVEGLLYVPELPSNSSCIEETKAYVPSNVTRIQSLMGSTYHVVGIAPWISVNCTQEYLESMRDDDARAAIFFQPGNAVAEPPPVSDPSWSLHDGGQWLSQNQFPIYALPGAAGSYLMTELAAYSGNLTDEPFGAELVKQYDSRDVVRLWTTIPVDNSSSGIPSLWVFLIIVLAILLFVVMVTSFMMHLVQRRHRRSLQRRVANGEVDLEALGIKRLNVPQEVLNKMPQFVYTSNADEATKATSPTTNTDPKAATAASRTHRIVHFSQPTCPICLDEFVSAETTVRELPCRHIFHPECIDPFLKENSSLCPMCKKSALPPGYCPVQVTNLMVRRERLIRRMRQRVRIVHGEEVGGAQGSYGRRRRLYDTMTRRFHVSAAEAFEERRRQADGGVPDAEAVEHGTEMADVPLSFPAREIEQTDTIAPLPQEQRAEVLAPDMSPPPEVTRQGTAARRAWRRERLASVQVQQYDQEARAADAAVGPAWRRMLSKIFPRSS